MSKIKPAGHENKHPSNRRNDHEKKIKRMGSAKRRSDQVQLKRSAGSADLQAAEKKRLFDPSKRIDAMQEETIKDPQ